MRPPVVKSPPRTHETADGQPDDFEADLNALDQVGPDKPRWPAHYRRSSAFRLEG